MGFGLILGIVAVAIIGSSTTKPAQEQAPVAEKPIVVSAYELVAAYDQNEVAADAGYKDRLIEVSGTVTQIGRNVKGDAFVALDVGYRGWGILCFARGDRETKLAALSRGQFVNLRGRCCGRTQPVPGFGSAALLARHVGLELVD